MAVYSSEEEFQQAQEEEFKTKITEVEYYYGHKERVTLDGEWTEQELQDELRDEVMRIVQEFNNEYKDRALKDSSMRHDEYVSTKIIEQLDLVEIYNTQYDKRRSEGLFGIHYFDDWVKKELTKVLKNNLVTK